ncbi:hypothetical protein ElyMa_000011500 [Elysia marginata]|uniref:Uncharacterized protein n=1 Tax=Elysia marginata TaxID=1093978 RepID=A0AAV4E9X8_9GAST|nr:hypothetical protein ElyMa_000011500 [Elysia marginata]
MLVILQRLIVRDDLKLGICLVIVQVECTHLCLARVGISWIGVSWAEGLSFYHPNASFFVFVVVVVARGVAIGLSQWGSEETTERLTGPAREALLHDQ